jgi:hypothetical protein
MDSAKKSSKLQKTVESRSGAVATDAAPFHSPLIKPDVQISRIRLSDKGPLCLRPRQVGSPSFQSQESKPLWKRFASRPLDLMLIAQPSTEPIPHVTIQRAVGLTHRLASQFRVDSSHQLSGFLTR